MPATIEDMRENRSCSHFICMLRAALCTLAFLSALISASAQDQTFTARTNLVTVPVLVEDTAGHAAYGLNADDFIVEDDQTPQLIHLEVAPESQPLSLVIALECGRRVWREFSRIGGLPSMLDPILSNPDNEAALLLFDSKLKLVEDFTTSGDQIEARLHKLESGDGGAAILDAVAYSTRLLARRPENHLRVLLLVSETRDHGSRFSKLDDVVKLIGSTNTEVYALSFSPYVSRQLDALRGSNADEWTPNVDFIEKFAAIRQALRKNTPKTLAAMTGGEYELFMTRNRFETDVNRFTNHLQSRYLLSFEPSDPHPGWHQIRVRLREQSEHQAVVYRRSYWVEAR